MPKNSLCPIHFGLAGVTTNKKKISGLPHITKRQRRQMVECKDDPCVWLNQTHTKKKKG